MNRFLTLSIATVMVIISLFGTLFNGVAAEQTPTTTNSTDSVAVDSIAADTSTTWPDTLWLPGLGQDGKPAMVVNPKEFPPADLAMLMFASAALTRGSIPDSISLAEVVKSISFSELYELDKTVELETAFKLSEILQLAGEARPGGYLQIRGVDFGDRYADGAWGTILYYPSYMYETTPKEGEPLPKVKMIGLCITVNFAHLYGEVNIDMNDLNKDGIIDLVTIQEEISFKRRTQWEITPSGYVIVEKSARWYWPFSSSQLIRDYCSYESIAGFQKLYTHYRENADLITGK